ncbi:hypothetical protein [Bradyrhizobium australiense]|uniref:Uncharacterized protein n=1 Tax=Bradyrhizobium australiense TaxID=2721161 RepID=A0A7Y4GSV3_9BRAD|nr:hypothetical protein [Bradyrhizobium australiense]NOJ41375.1 hypothetical protein [Bradyrhizobium australiense]
MAADSLWASAFGGSSGGGLLSFLGLGGSGSVPVMSGTGLGAGTGGLSFPMFAGGTSYAPGGPAMINEGGRGEIVNLPSGAQVIPHDISMQMAAAAGNDKVTIHGGTTNIIVQGNADDKAMATMKRELAQRDADFERRVIEAYRKAKIRRQI